MSTKLHTPPIRPDLVSRPRLIERLDEGLLLGCKLTLISAPAGFGKTSLLSEWSDIVVRRRGDQVRTGAPAFAPDSGIADLCLSWLSLDGDDNDPTRFWAHLIGALRTIPVLGQARVGESLLASLRSPAFASDAPSMESLWVGLINDIAAAGPLPFVLVLDDLHVIVEQQIHDGLLFLLDNMPSLPRGMHLVLSSRADPPWPLARMRARAQVVELRSEDLRFTEQEAAIFLNDVMHLDLSPGDVSALEARTEGWIAGLYMAAISMQGRAWAQGARDMSKFIRAFTGSHRFIIDYLVEEVLDQQPAAIQAFLLKTSILDRMCASLCDAVIAGEKDGGLRSADSQEILAYLDRANLFVVPLDDERRWFRYHRLFAELLRKRLHHTHPDVVPILHGRAGAWCQEHGLNDTAIDHALTAGDFEWAAHLIEQAAESTLMRGQFMTFAGWVDALPDQVVRARPSLCLLYAWALLLIGSPLKAVQERLRDANRAADRVPGEAVLQAFIAILQGRIAQAAELSRRALEQISAEDQFLRAIATWSLGISQLACGDIRAGGQVLDSAARMSQEAGNVVIAVTTLCHLASLCVASGQLDEAQSIYGRALDLAVDEQGRTLPIASRALMGLGEVLRERSELEDATRYLTEGIALSRQWTEVGALDGYISLARVRQAQGDAKGAIEAIQEAMQIAIRFDVTELDDMLVALYHARLHIAQGRIEAAAQIIAAYNLESFSPSVSEDPGTGGPLCHFLLYELAGTTLARLWIAQGHAGRAAEALELMLLKAEKLGQIRSVVEILVVKALALQARGDVDGALSTLTRALRLAAPAGYVRIFCDEGAPLAKLLRAVSDRQSVPHRAGMVGARPLCGASRQNGGSATTSRQYVDKLLAAYQLRVPHSGLRVEGMSVVPADTGLETRNPEMPFLDSLSRREIQVLRLLGTELSTPEMARELYISVNTVRTHIKSIYDKLDVHRRIAAVQKAEALGLV